MELIVKQSLERQNPWWFNKDFDCGIDRLQYYNNLWKYLETPEILIINGARRTGKSTLMLQLIKKLLSFLSADSILYVNFDEPVFQSKSKDPSFLINLIEEYKITNPLKFLFVDEIQNYDHWSQTVKFVHDSQKDIKIVLTGSTSAILKDVAVTKLSGRYFHQIVYPLSFREFLEFKKYNNPTIHEKRHAFAEYIKFGAFPRIVIEPSEDIKTNLLNSYFQTIYLKDIIYPNKLRNNKDLFDLLYFVFSNAGKPFSYTSVSVQFGISIDTIKEYLRYCESSWIISGITKFDHSLKKQMANPKKHYTLDTGMINAVAFQFSENYGRLIENLVYITLSRKYNAIYYHKEKHESDFLVKENIAISAAFQVTKSLADTKTKQREINGIVEAMNKYDLKQGFILTENESDTVITENKSKIYIKPIYEWLLEND